MAEDHADDAQRKGGSAPGMEGEGGQYTEGDFGDSGSVEAPADNPAEGEDPHGDYSDADASGTAHEADVVRERLTDGQVNTTADERGPLHGDPDGER
jgi:hypothetical protein